MEFADLKANFLQYLYMPDHEYLDIVFATILANRIQGDPVWIFVVGSPGSCKTEVLRTLESDETYHVSKLRAASLISGYVDRRSKADVDHSLLPKINNKVLIVKDFSTVLSMRSEEREEIFSILRDAYDGYASVPFGTGEKSYTSKFGMIAAMTPAIEIYRELSASLGERFLYVRPEVGDRKTLCLTALNNINIKDQMRAHLKQIARTFLENAIIHNTAIDQAEKETIVELSDVTATIRSYVARDRRDFNTVLMPPVFEVATRICQQVMKLYIGLRTLKSDALRLTRRVLADCVPINRRIVCEALSAKDNVTIGYLERHCEMSLKTVRIIVADLEKLGLATVVKQARGENLFSISESVKKLFNPCEDANQQISKDDIQI
jgi:hypothetical protein